MSDNEIQKKIDNELLAGQRDLGEITKFYDNWAVCGYDKEITIECYKGPPSLASAVAELYPDSVRDQIEILDVGAGTGQVGVELQARGFRKMDALDPSCGMLEVAKTKNIYRHYYKECLQTDALTTHNGYYDCVITCGCLTPNHIPASSIPDFPRLTKKGGHVVLTLRSEFDDPVYYDSVRSEISSLQAKGIWELKDEKLVNNYGFDKNGKTLVLKVL